MLPIRDPERTIAALTAVDDEHQWDDVTVPISVRDLASVESQAWESSPKTDASGSGVRKSPVAPPLPPRAERRRVATRTLGPGAPGPTPLLHGDPTRAADEDLLRLSNDLFTDAPAPPPLPPLPLSAPPLLPPLPNDGATEHLTAPGSPAATEHRASGSSALAWLFVAIFPIGIMVYIGSRQGASPSGKEQEALAAEAPPSPRLVGSAIETRPPTAVESAGTVPTEGRTDAKAVPSDRRDRRASASGSESGKLAEDTTEKTARVNESKDRSSEPPMPERGPSAELKPSPLPEEPLSEGAEFDKSAAAAALAQAAAEAAACRGDGPGGSTHVLVTFAPSGRVTSARLDGSAFGGTPTGSCIAKTLRTATVPPFSGGPTTVRKLVTLR